MIRPRPALFVATDDQLESLDSLLAETPNCVRLTPAECAEYLPPLRRDVIAAGALDDALRSLELAPRPEG